VTAVEFRGDLWHQKTRVPGLSCDVICVILCLAVLVELRLVTDRQTDRHRQTDRQTDSTVTINSDGDVIVRRPNVSFHDFCGFRSVTAITMDKLVLKIFTVYLTLYKAKALAL